MIEFDQIDLGIFVHYCNDFGYASGNKSVETKNPDGSTSICIECGSWRYEDSWDGGEPFCGRIRVFCRGVAVWNMAYLGAADVNKDELADVYGVLRKALHQMPLTAPFRGPSVLHIEDMEYMCSHEGPIGGFHGLETIYRNGNLVYEGRFFGGFVNQIRE